MSRNFITEGIILRSLRFGEIHKNVAILSPEHGIIHATAYGALKMKSKLRSTVQLFGHVKAYIYHDPVKNSYKITDMELKSQFYGISESIERFFAASLFAEIILKSFGGGETGEAVFALFLESLAILSEIAAHDMSFLIVQFIYRYLAITGFGPELRICSRCGKILDETTAIFFEAKSREFLCGECSPKPSIPVFPGMIKYLAKTSTLPLSKAMAIRLEKEAVLALKSIMYALIEETLEVPLASIKSGEGIL
jgi:DNA repair protein RecO (recombination protein O)